MACLFVAGLFEHKVCAKFILQLLYVSRWRPATFLLATFPKSSHHQFFLLSVVAISVFALGNVACRPDDLDDILILLF